MKRLAAVIAILLVTSAAYAQQKFQTKMIDIRYGNPHDIYAAVRALGSAAVGSELTFNNEMHTIAVRDYPENIAAIEDAIGRLDKPAPPAAELQLKISLLIGSKVTLPGPDVPEDLVPVVKQLQSTLRYSHYGLLAANIHHTKAGEGIEGSGIAEPALIGNTSTNPIFYNYRLRNIHVEEGTINVEEFTFGMRVPVQMNKTTQYQNVGFNTPVSIKPNEKVVIGTTTMGDRAVIVVLMANAGS